MNDGSMAEGHEGLLGRIRENAASLSYAASDAWDTLAPEGFAGDEFVVDAKALLRRYGSDFVEELFHKLYGRDPAPKEVGELTTLMEQGMARIEIIRNLAASPEALERGARVKGLNKEYGKHRRARMWSRVPVIGAFYRFFSALFTLPRRLRELNMRLDRSVSQLDTLSAAAAELSGRVNDVRYRVIKLEERLEDSGVIEAGGNR